MRAEYHDILVFGTEQVLGDHEAVCEPAAYVLNRLVEGNTNYKVHESNPTALTNREHTADNGQTPCAVVVCCADSRVPPEHIFHAGLGELFVIRNAGNLMDTFSLGSVEYAVEHLNAPLVVIMGHTGCGAVGAALHKEQAGGGLGQILAEVTEAIRDEIDPREAERKNLLHSMNKLGRSEILKHLHQEGKVEFCAAIYDIKSGHVDFLKN